MSDVKLANVLASEFVENVLARLDSLEERISDLEKKRQRETKNYNINAAKFDEFKRDFQAGNPHNRTDPFSIEELVLWASYILKDGPRREILNHTEFYKRVKSVKKIIEYYKAPLVEQSRLETDADILARLRTRDYLEFTLLSVKVGGENIGFWQATSDWALNQFGNEVGSWQKYKDLPDEPLK